MGRLTISLPDELHQALKEAAVRRNSTIGELIAESVEFYGIKSEASAAELVEEARRRSGLSPEEAERLALEATRAARRG